MSAIDIEPFPVPNNNTGTPSETPTADTADGQCRSATSFPKPADHVFKSTQICAWWRAQSEAWEALYQKAISLARDATEENERLRKDIDRLKEERQEGAKEIPPAGFVVDRNEPTPDSEDSDYSDARLVPPAMDQRRVRVRFRYIGEERPRVATDDEIE